MYLLHVLNKEGPCMLTLKLLSLFPFSPKKSSFQILKKSTSNRFKKHLKKGKSTEENGKKNK